MPRQDDEIQVEVTLTIPELHAVVKSLSIGYDQLQGKIMRLGPGKRSDETHSEAGLLLSAKQEMESILQEATRRERAVS